MRELTIEQKTKLENLQEEYLQRKLDIESKDYSLRESWNDAKNRHIKHKK